MAMCTRMDIRSKITLQLLIITRRKITINVLKRYSLAQIKRHHTRISSQLKTMFSYCYIKFVYEIHIVDQEGMQR